MSWRIVCIMPINYHGGRTFKVHVHTIDPKTINFETHVIDQVIVSPYTRYERKYKLGCQSDHGVVKSFELKEGNRLAINFENRAPLLVK